MPPMYRITAGKPVDALSSTVQAKGVPVSVPSRMRSDEPDRTMAQPPPAFVMLLLPPVRGKHIEPSRFAAVIPSVAVVQICKPPAPGAADSAS